MLTCTRPTRGSSSHQLSELTIENAAPSDRCCLCLLLTGGLYLCGLLIMQQLLLDALDLLHHPVLSSSTHTRKDLLPHIQYMLPFMCFLCYQ